MKKPAQSDHLIPIGLRGGLLATLVLSLCWLALPSSAMAITNAPSGNGIEPEIVEGNPKCEDYGLYELKFEPPATEEKTDELGILTVKITVKSSPDGQVFDWESKTVGVDLVIVKGGNVGSNVYTYDPPEEETEDTSLHAPINPSEKYANLSHVSFCYDIELEVEKTAETTFTRKYEWEIEKTNSAPEPIVLATGQTFEIPYKVKVSVAIEMDSDWAVSGTITVHNPAPDAAMGVNVEDEISGGLEVTNVDCNGEGAGNGLPAMIAAGGDLVCTYSRSLPDGTSRTNTATATSTTPGIGDGEGTAPIEFGAPSETIDECIQVTDSLVGALGEACANESPKTFEYKFTIGPYTSEECGEHQVINTAVFVTNDTEASGEDSSTAVIEVRCEGEGGCTLTQGYWKTHSQHGPAPYDETWAKLPSGADTLFLDQESPWTWYVVFWTPPQKGNAYLILAHQYEAAILNLLNGAEGTPELGGVLNEAKELLEEYGPENPPKKGPDRKLALELATYLAEYNEGLIGPGHCSEDGQSSNSA
jgi:hypothetical protein